jgi:hypothetical protein
MSDDIPVPDVAGALQESIARMDDELLRKLREQLHDLGEQFRAEREHLIALIDNELAKRAGSVN